MTGYASSHFRHRCPAQGCYIEQLPCWDDLIEAFPRNIRPTDIDGMVEINGSLLFLEEKSPGKSLESGQRRALAEIASRDRTTVACFRPGIATDLQVLIMDGGEPTGWRDASRDQFREWLHRWAQDADLRRSAA